MRLRLCLCAKLTQPGSSTGAPGRQAAQRSRAGVRRCRREGPVAGPFTKYILSRIITNSAMTLYYYRPEYVEERWYYKRGALHTLRTNLQGRILPLQA